MLESVSKENSILIIGTSFKASSIALRERLARLLSNESGRESLHDLPRVSESSVLVTCNRVESLFVTDNPRKTEEAFFDLVEKIAGVQERKSFYVLGGIDGIKHLFRVASGLDSIAVGEEQILGQVKKLGIAERVARNAKAVLSALFDTAVRVGERARAGYKTGEFERSASSLAIKIARRKLGRMPRKVLLIGTGKMIQLASSELGSRAEVYVATKRRGKRNPIRGKITTYDSIGAVADGCDLIVSATNHNGFLLTKEDFETDRRRVVVDLGFPRNIDPEVNNQRGTLLLDLDDLGRENERKGNGSKRLAELERFVAQEAEEFERTLIATRLTKLLPSLYAWAEEVRRSESRGAIRRLNSVSEREQKVVETLSRRLMSKFLAPPTRFVRSSQSTTEQLRRIKLVSEAFMLLDPTGRK